LLVVALIAGITAFAVITGDDNGATGSKRCPSQIPADVEPVAVGDAIPNFSLPELDGDCVHLAGYRGHSLVMNFWASWCHPCRVEFPLLHEARDRFTDRGLEVIGVVHNDIASDARGFAEETGADWPLLFDEDNVVSKMFGVSQIPQTFFIARDGTLVSHVYGLTSARDLNAEIERLLKR
jgi:cytochrome c biogenesis protein CcmG/thiol:disulfide interchange protein DsbE